MTIGIENSWDGESDNEETDKFGGEIIGVRTVEKTIEQAPEESSGKSDFDMFPGGFVNGGEEADNTIMTSPIVEKMG